MLTGCSIGRSLLAHRSLCGGGASRFVETKEWRFASGMVAGASPRTLRMPEYPRNLRVGHRGSCSTGQASQTPTKCAFYVGAAACPIGIKLTQNLARYQRIDA